MRYVIEDENGDSISIESRKTFDPDKVGAVVTVGTSGQFIFTHEEFKEFRKAVGYVWQEVENV